MADDSMQLYSTRKELAETRAQRDDLLQNHHTPLHGTASTLLTYGAAAAEGAFRGVAGAKANIGGVVPITGILGAGMAIGAAMIDDPTMKEALNAGARGLGAPAASEAAYRATLKWRNPLLLQQLEALDAFAAAQAAAPNSAATAAAGAAAGIPAK